MTFPLWYLTILMYFVASTAVSLLQRRLAQTTNVPLSLLPALVFTIFVFPIAATIGLLQGNIAVSWQPELVLLMLLAAVALGAFNVIPFHLSKHVDATQYIILSNFYTPFTVLVGVFILGEAFSVKQFLGMLLLLIGGIMVAVKGLTRQSFRVDRYSVFVMFSSLVLGTGLAAEKAALSYITPSAYMIIGFGLQALVTLLFAMPDWKNIKKLTRLDWKDITKVGIARTGHILGWFLSIAISRNLALIATITSFRIPLVFIASFFILRERDHLGRRFAGVAVATIGLLLI